MASRQVGWTAAAEVVAACAGGIGNGGAGCCCCCQDWWSCCWGHCKCSAKEEGSLLAVVPPKGRTCGRGENEERKGGPGKGSVLLLLLLSLLLLLLSSPSSSAEKEVLLGEEARDETPEDDKGLATGTHFTGTRLCPSVIFCEPSSASRPSDSAAALSNWSMSTMDLISCCSWPTPKVSSAVCCCGEAGVEPGAVVVVRMDCFACRKSRSHWSSLLLLAVLVLVLLPAGRGVMMDGRLLARCLCSGWAQQNLWWVKGELGLLLDGESGWCVSIKRRFGGW